MVFSPPSRAKDKTNPWVYYYSTAYRRPEDAEIYEQFVEQDQASTVVKSRKEDRHWARSQDLFGLSFNLSSGFQWSGGSSSELFIDSY